MRMLALEPLVHLGFNNRVYPFGSHLRLLLCRDLVDGVVGREVGGEVGRDFSGGGLCREFFGGFGLILIIGVFAVLVVGIFGGRAKVELVEGAHIDSQTRLRC